MVSMPPDPKGRLVSIFVGAVLLPSVALSALSFFAVPKQAEATKIALLKRAEWVLYYVEEDLERTARSKALEAARAVGSERLLEGRAAAIRAALEASGLQATFEELHLEASAPLDGMRSESHPHDVEGMKEALKAIDAPSGPDEEVLRLAASETQLAGTLHFRYTCGYAHGALIREYFEKEFANPDQAMVIRVTEPEGFILYETAPTADAHFEVHRTMMSPSFRGLSLYLRYKDRSIQQEVRRLAVAKTVLIAFIDLILGAGLFLVYSNVRREIRLSRLKSDFVANVSHELKTPLALIRLFAETLELGRVPSPDKAQQYYRVINKESQRLTQLINNILDFSRIEAGRREYRFAPTDVTRIVDEVLESYRFPIEQQGFTLEVHASEDIPAIEVDKEALSQALINLLNNAIKYSREEKYIRVDVKRDADRVLLSVTDRGIGVAKSEQKKIFEKFYRAEDSLVHETKGSGLGLSLVRHIVEAHGGEVQVESSPGKGSTFTLVLPIHRENAPGGLGSEFGDGASLKAEGKQ
jgi:signal transduction histidine kinase